MTNCDNTNNNKLAASRKAVCPINGLSYSGVKIKTIIHQIKKPWQLKLLDQRHFFCDDTNCDVVYFGEDNSALVRDDLRMSVGQKSQGQNKTICYCFDVQFSDIDADKVREKTKAFVVEQTRRGSCDCELRNPSGKCCLKNFP